MLYAIIALLCGAGLYVAHRIRTRPDQKGNYMHKHIYPGAPRNKKWFWLITTYYLTSPIWGPIVGMAA